MIRYHGTVPYPRSADPAAVRATASDLRRLAAEVEAGAGRLDRTAEAAQATWVGQASQAFAQHTLRRSTIVRAVARSIAEAPAVLERFAAEIEATQERYSIAAYVEREAVADGNYPAAAVAIGAETGAVLALQAAGIACAASLGVIAAEIAAVEYLNVSRETLGALVDAATHLVESMYEAATEGDVDAFVSALNTTIMIPRADGSVDRTSVVGMTIDALPGVRGFVNDVQELYGTVVLLTAPTVTPVARPDLVAPLRAAGYVTDAPNAAQLGTNMSLLEDTFRATGVELDQSRVIMHTEGIGPDGRRVLTLTIPGIVPPGDGSWTGQSGDRNVVTATAQQITGTGPSEAALVDWVDSQRLPRDATINLFGHSQGGMVAQNLEALLRRRGYTDVNVVAYGSPDQQLTAGTGAFLVQNVRDPVPAARIGGDGGTSTTLHPGQRIVTVDVEVDTGLFDHHDARLYGRTLMGSGDPDAAALRRFLDAQRQVTLDPGRTGVVVLEGPRTPQGTPVEVRSPYSVGGRR